MGAFDSVVTLADAGKRYVKYDDAPALVTGLLRWTRRQRRSTLWALRHIDLEVERGEALGVIGRNGAGKSTMLSMLAGVTAPSEGMVAVRGRVAPLLRLGVGFHEELTGRENIYINGTILGLDQRAIDRAFDEIVGFAELESFIDTPVKFYSSGMIARLGFSTAIASAPDVLLVDEILAVGDLPFQIRSFERMVDLQRQGATILVVSHNLEAVLRLCSRVLVLHDGVSRFVGSASDGVSTYHELMRSEARAQPFPPNSGSPSAPITVTGVTLLDQNGSPTASYDSGAEMTVRLHVRFRAVPQTCMAGVSVVDQSHQLVYRDTAFRVGTDGTDGEADLEIRLTLSLPSGTYIVDPWVGWGAQPGEQAPAPPQSFYVTKGPSRGQANLAARYSLNPATPRSASGEGS